VVGDIQAELGIGASTLSHHLEKLKIEDLVTVGREGTFTRYRANTEVLRDLVGFLYRVLHAKRRSRPIPSSG
jgi:DNA-binding transcriptional ArsR family regulator